jgi:hypothetical protein
MHIRLYKPRAVEKADNGLCERDARSNLDPYRLMLLQSGHFRRPRLLRYVRSQADVSSARVSRTDHKELDAGGGDALQHVGEQIEDVFLGSLQEERGIESIR